MFGLPNAGGFQSGCRLNDQKKRAYVRVSGFKVSFVSLASALALAACAAPTPSSAPGDAQVVLGEIDTSSSRVSQRQLARLKVPSSAELIGKADTEVRDLFGDPSLDRSERNAKVWQYAHGGCILFFFMYEDDLTGRYAVTHIDARAPERGPAPIEDCVSHAYKSHYVAKAAL